MTDNESTLVGMGEAAYAAGGVLTAGSLGSCVAVALYDPRLRSGAMAHVMLPYPEDRDAHPGLPARHAPEAVAWLDQKMAGNGSRRTDLHAMIAGGANMFPDILDSTAIGERNVAVVKAALQKLHIRIAEEHVGGHIGRLVDFDTATGEFSVLTKR